MDQTALVREPDEDGVDTGQVPDIRPM